MKLFNHLIYFLIFLGCNSQAQTLDVALREKIDRVSSNSFLEPELEVTTYMPNGDGPFPLVVINHGRSLGDAKFQERYRPILAAREFVSRGYAVVVPMRQGFSKSGGTEISGGCNVHSNGIQQAISVKRTIEWASSKSWADSSRIVVIGQSHGGLTTLAYGTDPQVGVKLLINFAGGLRQTGCTAWEHSLISAFGEYGKKSKLQSIWFYGDNDSFFSPFVWKSAFEQYKLNGGQAELIAFGKFGNDAHSMFGSRNGLPIWVPVVMKSFESVGLPTKVTQVIKPSSDITPPPESGFATINDIGKVPVKNDNARDGYKKWLEASPPKAFAIHPIKGSWASTWGGDSPNSRALNNCSKFANDPCKLYAVDEIVVWSTE